MIGRKLVMAAVAVSLTVAASAQAATVADMFIKTMNVASDQSREGWIDRTGPGVVNVGDAIRGYFHVDELNGLPPETAVNMEWTGVFQLNVAAMVPSPAIPGGTRIIFAADPTFQGTDPAGTAFRMYEDPAKNFFNVPVGPTIPGNASDGTPFWTIGFGPNSYFFADTALAGPIPVGFGSGVANTVTVASSQFGLDLLAWNTGNTTLNGFAPYLKRIAQVGFTIQPLPTGNHFVGNSQLNGTQNTPTAPGYEYLNHLQVNFMVPVPASLWTGLGLFGMLGAMRLMRNRRHAA